MTPQERDLLARFLDDLSRSNPGRKDAEAQAAIATALSGNADAAYVLVQHAILSDQALLAAQTRIVELEKQTGGGQSPDPSFLGAAFGKASPNPPGAPLTTPTAVPPTAAPPPGYAPPPYPDQGWAYPPGQQPYPQQQPYAPQPWGQGAPGPFTGGGGVGSFLRSAGTTAAGVAGGAFLFEGLSGLFGGHHGGLGLGGGGMGFGGGGGFGGGAPVENVTVNNYGDDSGDYGSDSGVDYDSDNGDSSGDDYS